VFKLQSNGLTPSGSCFKAGKLLLSPLNEINRFEHKSLQVILVGVESGEHFLTSSKHEVELFGNREQKQIKIFREFSWMQIVDMTDNIEECFNVLIFHFIVETSHLVLGLSQ
jgi:hypothetical protein